MFFFLTSRVISSVVAFLYPGYASYKTLSQRPAPEEELERWLMYWSVLGFVVGVEYVAEWLISWVPFYYTLKTLFLLYIALPQTQGSSYLYRTHLQPFFRSHETQIDTTLARLKSRLYSFLQQRARMLWDQAAVAMGQTPSAPYNTSGAGREMELEEELDSVQRPSLGNPIGGPLQLASSLWTSYGPGIVAGGLALVGAARAQSEAHARGSTNSGRRPGASVLTTPPSSRIRPSTTQNQRRGSVEERKRQLEAELRELDNDAGVITIEGLPISSGSGTDSLYAGTTSRSSSDSVVTVMKRRDHVRTRVRAGSNGSGRFEEVEVPSDVEGYEVDDEQPETSSRGGGGWFGWGASTSTEHSWKND